MSLVDSLRLSVSGWTLNDMATMSIRTARVNLAEVIRTAQTEAVFLQVQGNPAAVVVSPERYETLMTALEDIEDLAAVDAAMSEGGPNRTWEQVKGQLDLD